MAAREHAHDAPRAALAAGRRPTRRAAAGLLLPLSLLAGGCFRYVAVQPSAVQPQEEVRLRFSDDAAIRLAREFGRITPQLDARMAPRGGDSVLVSVWIGRHYPGTQFENVHQSVALARAELVEVRRRELSRTRTAAAAAGALAVFAVLIHRIFQQEDPETSGDDPINPPPPDPLVFRVPLRAGWIR